MRRVSVLKYLADKIQYVVERSEARDLAAYSDVKPADAVIARDRLLAWVKAAAGKASADG